MQTLEVDLPALIKSGALKGAFHTSEVPVGSEEQKPKKVFLLMQESVISHWRRDALVKVLSLAGWGGSVVIDTFHYPSLGTALGAGGGIDYLVFGKHSGQRKDLYIGFLRDTRHGDFWKEKVLVFDISSTESDLDYYVKQFKNLSDAEQATGLKG